MVRTAIAFVAIAVALLVPAPSLASTYAAQQSGCTQINYTTLYCPDASPIKVSALVTAPNEPLFGPFTVYQSDYANVSEPLDVFGNQCQAKSGATVTCFMALTGIPVSEGNGTLHRSLGLVLRSVPYPQISYARTVNLTIYHYLTRNQTLFLLTYMPTHSAYVKESDAYAYLCSAYSICNQGIESSIGVAGAYLSLALSEINKGMDAQALYNLSVANSTMDNGAAQYGSFLKEGNRIVNNVVLANYRLAAVYNSFQGHRASLANCTSGNATALSRLESQMAGAESYPMQNTFNGSSRYLQLVDNISKYANMSVAQCVNGRVNVPGTGGFIQRNIYAIVAVIAVAIVALYAFSRYRSHQEVMRIREGIPTDTAAELADEEQRHGEQPEAEAGAEKSEEAAQGREEPSDGNGASPDEGGK